MENSKQDKNDELLKKVKKNWQKQVLSIDPQNQNEKWCQQRIDLIKTYWKQSSTIMKTQPSIHFTPSLHGL